MERSVGVNPCVFCAQSRAPLLKMQQEFTFSVKISCFYWTKSFPSFSLIRRLQVQAVTRPRRPLALGMGGRERSFQTADCFCLLRVRPARMPKERANEGGQGGSEGGIVLLRSEGEGGPLPYTNKASSFGSQSPCTNFSLERRGAFSMTLPFSLVRKFR